MLKRTTCHSASIGCHAIYNDTLLFMYQQYCSDEYFCIGAILVLQFYFSVCMIH